jgi:hypothetical protein
MKSQLQYAKEKIRKNRDKYDIEFGKAVFGKVFAQSIEVENPGLFKELHLKPLDFNEEMFRLIEEETESELMIRKRAVRDYISKQGLAKYQDDIIQGMNKTARRVTALEDQETSLLILRLIVQHDSFALLEFVFNYVDKWKMYNRLFEKPNQNNP